MVQSDSEPMNSAKVAVSSKSSLPSEFGQESKSLDDLGILITQIFDLLHENSSTKSLNLQADDVILKVFPNVEKDSTNWFNSAYVGLAKNGDSIAWLARLGLAKLLENYFELKGKLMSSDSSNIQLTMGSALGDGSRKRRRLNHGLNIRYAISDNLSLCNSLTEFVMMSTEVGGTPNVNVMITCLQLFTLRMSESCSTLHLKSSQSNLDFLLRDCNGVLNHFLKLFDLQDNNFNIWVLTCLYLILSVTSDVESPDHEINIRVKNINRLIKYSLEFLRIQNLSKAASLVLCAILQAHLRSKISLLEIDSSILQQYETVIDISEINGPALLCKESVIFWSNTFDLCKIFKFKNVKLQAALPSDLPQLFSSKVINWLLSKFNQLEGLETTSDIESVCMMISWLSERRRI
ncbi:unnamed protein product [Ambrosiozyma monospora]|uniref:Unnamed protein product n=1 Tax=Ambrosiozyma monospora TaxID=43982 RepID=A0A9W7DPG6_AMBMO|nr:unnamed protein product [Ambrosiozyma monospora]